MHWGYSDKKGRDTLNLIKMSCYKTQKTGEEEHYLTVTRLMNTIIGAEFDATCAVHIQVKYRTYAAGSYIQISEPLNNSKSSAYLKHAGIQ